MEHIHEDGDGLETGPERNMAGDVSSLGDEVATTREELQETRKELEALKEELRQVRAEFGSTTPDESVARDPLAIGDSDAGLDIGREP